MTKTELEAFLAVLQYGSISAAAERLFITQPAMSRRMKSMEEELGYSLFERGRGQRSVELTENGKEFVPVAERLLALYINQSGKNKIFINNLFTVPEDLGVEKFRFSDTDDYLTPLCDCVEAGKPLGIDKTFAARFLIPVIDHSGAQLHLHR